MRVLWDSRTPLRFVHLMLVAFPLGLAEFVLLVTGLVLGIGTVVLFGVPLLVGLMLAWRRLARLERRLLMRFHGVSLPDPYRALTAATRFGRVRERLADPATWRDLAYLLLAFPLGLVSFTATFTAVSITFALLTAPLWVAVAGSDGRAGTSSPRFARTVPPCRPARRRRRRPPGPCRRPTRRDGGPRRGRLAPLALRRAASRTVGGRARR